MDSVFVLGYEDYLFISTDTAETWKGISLRAEGSLGDIPTIIIDRFDTLLIGSITNATPAYTLFFASADNGSTWQPRGRMKGNLNSIAKTPSEHLLAIADSGLMRSTDMGRTWAQTSLHASAIRAVTALSDEQFIVAHDSTISVTTDHGVTWTTSATGIALLNPQELTTIGDEIFLGTQFDVYHYSPNDSTWNFTLAPPLHLGAEFRRSFVLNDHRGNIFGARDTGIFSSSNFGATWRNVLRIDTSVGLNFFSRAQSGTLFFGADFQKQKGYFSRSSDNGATWAECIDENQIVSSFAGGSNGICFAGSTRGYNAPLSESSGLFISTNDGRSWSLTQLNTSNGVNVIAVDSSDDVFFVMSDTLFESTNKGATWLVVDTGYVGPMVVDAIGNLYISGNGVIRESRDRGHSWHDYTSGITGGAIVAMIADSNGYLLCATQSGGVFKASQQTTDVKISSDQQPTTLSLAAAYPNPSASTSTINYTIDHPMHVQIKIIDALGRVVDELIDASETAGEHAIAFDTKNFPAGMYAIQLRAENIFVMKEIVVVK